MNKGFYKLSLKSRIHILYILLTFLCISVTGGFAYNFAAKVMEQNALQLKQTMLNKTVQTLDESMRHMIVASYSLMMSETYNRVMNDVRIRDSSRFYTDLSLLQTPFAQLKQVEPAVVSVLLATPIGNFHSTQDSLIGDVDVDRLYKGAMDDPSWNVHWISGHEDELFQGKKRVITLLVRPLRNSFNNSYNLPDVYVIVNFSEDYVNDMIRQNVLDEQIRLFLLDHHGHSILPGVNTAPAEFSTTAFLEQFGHQQQGAFSYQNDDDEQLVNYSRLKLDENWSLVAVQSKSNLLGAMRDIRWLVLAIMIVCMLIALLFSSVLTRLLLSPLNKLYRIIQRVENNELEARFTSKYEDEVSVIGYRFNRMMGQIEHLIEANTISEQERLRYEIKALQAQINPHFLYNTLNTILWKSQFGQSEQVGEMIVSLSLLFKLGLNNGQEMTTVQQELNHVEQYMLLQQQCYEDMFTYTIRIDDAARNALVPKIMLQPLVENSILHGFKNLERPCAIEISAVIQGNQLKLSVTDNGHGLDAQAMNDNVQQPLQKHASYALYNIYSRLKLNYGADASMNFASIPNERTSVTIIIPFHGEEGVSAC
ncbi:sensor histidine kinase [Paenibacillus campi]|uniref:sensor histidine kinase n=1 Tax=Paenibacillus campi TaxID=3106031 RepID=UPI002AFF64B5|nr:MULTISPECIES: sensor histidine kinase [unclassified Paenibacillus]